jgi:hypothetical protein
VFVCCTKRKDFVRLRPMRWDGVLEDVEAACAQRYDNNRCEQMSNERGKYGRLAVCGRSALSGGHVEAKTREWVSQKRFSVLPVFFTISLRYSRFSTCHEI